MKKQIPLCQFTGPKPDSIQGRFFLLGQFMNGPHSFMSILPDGSFRDGKTVLYVKKEGCHCPN